MYTLNCKGRLLTLEQPAVMGIINATPDSFYAGSRMQSVDDILEQAAQMLEAGAVFIDIGGQSTRPGSMTVSVDEELHRVIPAIESIAERFPESFISIDTWYAKVAKEAVAAGACMVNDISAGSMDHDLLSTVAALKVPYVLMHMQGTPATMQQSPKYENITREILDFFIQKIAMLESTGITDIIIDPGFGFGKTIANNFELLRNLSLLQLPGRPLMAGLSRKSTVYKTIHTDAEGALNGSTVLHTIALMNGTNLLRVHDVKEAVETIQLITAYRSGR